MALGYYLVNIAYRCVYVLVYHTYTAVDVRGVYADAAIRWPGLNLHSLCMRLYPAIC